MMENLNPMEKEQAILLAKSRFYEDWSANDIVAFQLFTERLCMPFDIFHQAVEKILGCPVWTHEFGSWGHLQEEFMKIKPKPSLKEIFELIPKKKRIKGWQE
jgi:hypothetical protein